MTMNIEKTSSASNRILRPPLPIILLLYMPQSGTQPPDQRFESGASWVSFKDDLQNQKNILSLPMSQPEVQSSDQSSELELFRSLFQKLEDTESDTELSWLSSDQVPPSLTSIADAQTPELKDALKDLQEIRQEASEEGFLQPSDAAIDNATRLLPEMYHIFPRRFEVYSMPNGEIAIDAPSKHERSVILLCDSDGGALCLVNMNGEHRRARYCDAKILPDGFLREALVELRQQDEQAT